MSTSAENKALKNELTKQAWRDPRSFLACGFGSGCLPYIPGTCGTAVAVILYYMIASTPLWFYALITVLVIAVSIYLCGYVRTRYGLDDPGEACIDEFPGLLITLIAVPPHWHLVLIGFILFRFFDMVKPGPIGWLDRNIHSAFGMVLDDLVAGVCAAIVLQILMIWIV
jgi:phosphatidylglycerophosphatase A